MHRERERAAASLSVISGLLASLLAFVITALLPGTIASGELRADAMKQEVEMAPATVDVASAPGDDGAQVRHLVAPGDTFSSILAEQGLSAAEIRAWRQAAAGTFDLERLHMKHAFHLTFARDQGRLVACDYEIDAYSMLTLRLVHGQIQARLKAMPRLAAVRGVTGRVEASLATSATAAGVPVRMMSELSDLFGWEVDLQAAVGSGDEFRLLYTELRDEDGGRSRPGDILAAEITRGGRTLTALRYENERGEPEYYDLEGRVLGRPFLKYPVEFRKITSEYTGARFHPVLKRMRPHRGVDFSAPAGTPVRAVASGVVTFAGRNGEYGNQVGIDHESPWATSYSHLLRVARGIRLGSEVSKGQVIGYVGQSGMATGPHLHFMLFKEGEYVNPLTVKLPADEQLTGVRWRRFVRVRDDLIARLAALGRGVLELGSLPIAPVSLSQLARPRAASWID